MSSFQRMIAIPQEEYLALSTFQNVKEPLAQQFYALENRHTLEEKEADPYRRMILQSNTLDQMKQIKDQMRNSITVATPKPYQTRANALLQSVENVIKFNEKGEIYSKDGNLIPGSHLQDLIKHAVLDRRRNLTPRGWSDFVTVLRDHNVPKSILNRNTLDEMEGVRTSPTPTVTETPKRLTMQSRIPRRLQPKREVKPDPSAFKPLFQKQKKDLKFLKVFKP